MVEGGTAVMLYVLLHHLSQALGTTCTHEMQPGTMYDDFAGSAPAHVSIGA